VIVLDNPENKYNFSDTILIDKIADSQSPLKIDIQAGDRLTVESLLDIMLIESSNKSAYALSESIGTPKFVELMNKKAKELNLNSTSFTDPTGLSSNDVSTASDLAKLAVYILSNKNYSRIANISKFEELDVPGFGKITNSDELLGEIPDIICSKTGFTNEANGCLLLVTSNPKNNDYLINVVLGTDDRFTEMQKLINWSNITCK
jgi:D-alanyl-D-alanine carboxypeptidase (penicillin-binding protein 5/6)